MGSGFLILLHILIKHLLSTTKFECTKPIWEGIAAECPPRGCGSECQDWGCVIFTWNRFPIKSVLIVSLLAPLWRVVNWMETCASLNHRKQVKTEHSRNEVRWCRGKETRNWGLSRANAQNWRNYLWHRWDFRRPAAIRRPGNSVPVLPSFVGLRRSGLTMGRAS